MKIISISGLDGSGKSTQIKMLQRYLESQGKRVFYFHAVQFGIANKLTNSRPSDNDKKEKADKSVTSANGPEIAMRKIFLLIDNNRFKKLVRKLEKQGFDYILTDRYFYDSIVNISYLENKDSKVFAERFILKPDVAIYLQAEPGNIMQRERKPDQGIEYLKKKKEILDKKSIEWNLKIINGNRSQEDVFEDIKKAVE